MPTFIYIIENRVNGHAYVGKTKVPEKRWKRHKDAASKCSEKSSWLYKAMSKHGVENFEFRIIDEHEDEAYALKVLEPMWIKRMKDSGVHLYNMTDGGDGIPGYTHSSATIKKISESNKGRKLSEEQKRHLSEINKGIKPTDEARRKISEANKGKSKPPFTEAHKQKIAAARTGTHHSLEHREKLSAIMKNSDKVGHLHTDETKEIIRQKSTGQKQSAETRAKRSESLRRANEVMSDDARAKKSESLRRSWEVRRAKAAAAPDPATSSDQSS
jgi:hypothetical protein